LGRVFAPETKCLIAKLDAEANSQAAARFGVSGYPTLKFFGYGDEKQKSKPVDYNGDRSLKDLVQFVNAQCQTARMEDGELTGTAGVIDEFVPLIRLIMATSGDQQKVKAALKEFKEAETNLRQSPKALSPYFERAVAYYVRVAEKMGKDMGHVQREKDRLERILTSNAVADIANRDDLNVRFNILRAFAAAGTSGHDEL
jgi:protein disulfide-isomerase A6